VRAVVVYVSRRTAMAKLHLSAFDVFYAAVYGDRWPKLRAALCEPVRHVALVNPFCASPAAVLEDLGAKPFALPECTTHTYELSDVAAKWPQPQADAESGLLNMYLLDAASLVPAILLQAEAGHRVYDMCSAPGGKCLAIAFMLFANLLKQPSANSLRVPPSASASDASGRPQVAHSLAEDAADDLKRADQPSLPIASDASKVSTPADAADSDDETDDDEELTPEALLARTLIVANDASQARRVRLQHVLRDYLPETCRDRVQTSCQDASLPKWSSAHRVSYDRILVDAPCSSDRHVLHDPVEFEQWQPGRSKNMAQRQYALLGNAIKAAKSKARIVYSTCSLSPLENDDVIDKYLRKKVPAVKVVRIRFSIGESTRHGWHVLPDTCGWGPIYCAVLEKL